MKFYLAFALVLAIGQGVRGTPQQVGLSFPVIHLKNGKDINAAEIKTFDASSGRVVILSDRSIASIQIQLLPDDVAARIISLVPPEPPARPPPSASMQYGSESPQGAAVSGAMARRVVPQSRDRQPVVQSGSDERSESELVERSNREIKRLAKSRAYKYYRYEMRPGSGYVAVTESSIELEEPEEIPGWPGRRRVRGEIALEFFDSVGRSFNSTTGRFEVTTETNGKGATKVVDFTPLR
jgi:hypothetical protein